MTTETVGNVRSVWDMVQTESTVIDDAVDSDTAAPEKFDVENKTITYHYLGPKEFCSAQCHISTAFYHQVCPIHPLLFLPPYKNQQCYYDDQWLSVVDES